MTDLSLPEGLSEPQEGISESLADLLGTFSREEIAEALEGLPDAYVASIMADINSLSSGEELAEIPDSPIQQAAALDALFISRPHLAYLAARLVQAIQDVENGINRRILVSMPPRAGKSTLISLFLIVWILRKHPAWKIMLTSHGERLATTWGRQIRRIAVGNPDLGIHIAPDAGAAAEWETVQGGSVISRGIAGDLTGRGAKVLIIDDPHKGFVEVQSEAHRNMVWDWWTGTAQPRLEPPALVIVVMTRWHQDDLAGRLLSREWEGNPDDWEQIRLPAIAEENDLIGRAPGEPMLSPLIPDETLEQATARWEQVKRDIGTMAFSALYQQAPSPAKGIVFDTSWFRYWTLDPSLLPEDPEDDRVVLLNPADLQGRWLDSWDCAFKDTSDSDYVVAQRWCRSGAQRYLLWQMRARMSFTATVSSMSGEWADPNWHWGMRVNRRLVEDKANGTAVIDTLKRTITGLHPINPTNSKISRAYSVTPECEAGNVVLPHPSMPGYEWVLDLLHELANFPKGSHDDQTDALTQALSDMSDAGMGQVVTPEQGTQQRTPAIPAAAALIGTRVPDRRYSQPGYRR